MRLLGGLERHGRCALEDEAEDTRAVTEVAIGDARVGAAVVDVAVWDWLAALKRGGRSGSGRVAVWSAATYSLWPVVRYAPMTCRPDTRLKPAASSIPQRSWPTTARPPGFSTRYISLVAAGALAS